jgi:hypothetical protein
MPQLPYAGEAKPDLTRKSEPKTPGFYMDAV